MFRDFDEIESRLLDRGVKKRIAFCGSQDSWGLEAIVRGRRTGVLDAVLIGDEKQTAELLERMGEVISDYELVNEFDDGLSANLAVQMVYEGEADIPMKGLIQSTAYLTAVAHPIKGLYPLDGILSEATVFHYPDSDRLVFAADCALNMAPTLDEKVEILNNTIDLARAFGLEQIRVAALSASEKVNPSMPSSVEAQELSEMEWGPGVTVQGPLALDNALSPEAAAHKGIDGDVAGKADVLLVPDLVSGNILHKAMHFFGHMRYASVMCGTTSPVIFNSRTDDPSAKYYSILSAILQDEYLNTQQEQ